MGCDFCLCDSPSAQRMIDYSWAVSRVTCMQRTRNTWRILHASSTLEQPSMLQPGSAILQPTSTLEQPSMLQPGGAILQPCSTLQLPSILQPRHTAAWRTILRGCRAYCARSQKRLRPVHCLGRSMLRGPQCILRNHTAVCTNSEYILRSHTAVNAPSRAQYTARRAAHYATRSANAVTAVSGAMALALALT